MLGFDEVAAVNVGAAPTPREVLVFFHAIGVPLAELWGMSETCGAGACNPPEKIKIGTVGPPTPGVEAKLAEDGELLVRSDVVMTGYRNLPDRTAEALDADGWLHTGDIAHDRRGRLHLDRRPQEGADHQRGRQEHVAGQHRVRAQGRQPADRAGVRDRRRALLQHGADRARRRLRARVGRPERDRGQEPRGARAARTRSAPRCRPGVDKANDQLSRVEQIKKFTIVEGDWAPGGDELTPTMKLKRRPIAEKYADEIEAMYAQ